MKIRDVGRYLKLERGAGVGNYTVSQKNIPDIFDRNLKTNYLILIIFGTNIPDTTCHQMIIQFSTSPSILFLHYLRNTQPAKYHFFIQSDMIA